MWVLTEIADWFDKKRSTSKVILDQMVEDSNYNHGVIIMASGAHGFMDFGAGLVDILRLGDGVKEGGWKGWGTDGLRLVAILPFGKISQVIKSAKGFKDAKLIADIGGKTCSWIASVKALAHVGFKNGGKLFASVDDLAKAVGFSLDRLYPMHLNNMARLLNDIGARVGPVRRVSTLREIELMIPNDGSVVLVTVRIVDKVKQAGGKIRAHVIYFYRDIFGRIRIMDRTVGGLPNVAERNMAYLTLEEVAKKYTRANVAEFVPHEAVVLHNVFVRTVEQELPKLVIPVLGVIAEDRN